MNMLCPPSVGTAVFGVVAVAVGRLLTGLLEAEAAVAETRVGAPPAVQVEGGEAGLGQRPLPGVAPGVGAHHEESQRRLLVDAGVDAAQAPVVPAQVQAGDVDGGLGAEVHVAEGGGAADLAVGPGTDQQFAALSGFGRGGLLAPAGGST